MTRVLFVTSPALRLRPDFQTAAAACTRRPQLTVAKAAGPPRQIGGATNQLKEAIQAGLRNQCSRMDVELPFAADFGLEKRPAAIKSAVETAFSMEKTAAGLPSAVANNLAKAADISDREVGRLIMEMFLGNQLKMAIAFPTENAAKTAKSGWGTTTKECKVLSVEKDLKGRRGFGAAKAKKGDKKAGPSAAAAALGDVEVLIMVGLRPNDMKLLIELAEEYGPGTVIILVNCRLDELKWKDDGLRDYVTTSFTRIYHFKPDPHPNWAGGILFRKYPDPWLLCRKAAVGPPTRLMESEEQRPSLEEMDAAFRKEAQEAKNDGNVISKIANFLDRK